MELNELAEKCAYLGKVDLSRYTNGEIERLLREVLVVPMLVFTVDANEVWYRGVKCKSPDDFQRIQDSLYRPEAKAVDDGRAHLCDEPCVFYASWNPMTVLREINPRPGEYVRLVAVRPRTGRGVHCTVVGEVAHIANNGSSSVNHPGASQAYINLIGDLSDRQRLSTFHLVDAFLADQFRCPDNSRYRLTGTFAKIVNPHAQVIYPSVKSFGAANLAVPRNTFDEMFEVLWTQLYEPQYFGYGVYDLKELRWSCDFASDGEINWDRDSPRNKKGVPARHSIELGMQVSPDYTGWRVPQQT